MTTIRTYMNFSEKIDPAKIATLADLEMSVALASTLVTFNDQRGIIAALADHWEIIPPTKIQFTLKKSLKWSDGSDITADQYKACLERARREFPDDLKSLFESLQSIDVTDSRTLSFSTKNDVVKSGILLKLTEPMYALVATKNGKLDLARSSGPFILEKQNHDGVSLSVNEHWYKYENSIPKRVEIVRPKNHIDAVENFEHDEWANLISGDSLMNSETHARLKKEGYGFWERSLDRLFALYPSKEFLSHGGREFIGALAQKMDKQKLLIGLSGFQIADQFFPSGSELWSAMAPSLPRTQPFKAKKTIRILVTDNSYTAHFIKIIPSLIKVATGAEVSLNVIPASQIQKHMKDQDYDVLAVRVPVADPNFDGAISFFFERETAFVKSSDGLYDFAAQVKEARGLTSVRERASRMKEIVVRAQEAGHFLPIFHVSSFAISKPGVDLSGMPSSDEAIVFSKVRVK